MAYTVTTLITDAYYLSGRLSRGLQTITGDQLNTGLRLLNDVIAVKSVNNRLIPYFTKYEFETVVGQEEYFIPKLINVETATFEYGTVRMAMCQSTRKKYQGTSRAEGINSLMAEYYVEKTKGGANLFMYFLPNEEYTVTLWGKFSLSSVALNQDLSATLDQFYIAYLKYALAEYICHDNNITFQPQNKEKLEEYELSFLDTSPPDLTVVRLTAFSGVPGLNWADVNLGHLWRPS